MTQYYFNLPSSQTTTTTNNNNKTIDMSSQSILPPLTTEAERAVTNDLNEVYGCAAQISNQLLVGPSIINASAKNKTVHLPSISELDCMIDSTGRMMRVLDDAKHKWFIPSSPPLPVTQYRTVVSNIPQDGRTTITKRPFKRQRTVSLNNNKVKNKCHSCKSTETPEWRKGPLGPRTLCNACGLIWTKLCKQRLDDDISRRKFKNNSSNSSSIISDDCNSVNTTTSSTSLNNKKYTLSFLLS